jgi:hypothetical protein
MATDLVMYENIVPLVAPVDGTTTNPILGEYLDIASANRAAILVYFGVVTSSTATDTMTLTLEASTASTSNAGEEAIPFNYRLSVAKATGNTWGAVTAATSAGVALGASTVFDGFAILIDIDPAIVVGLKPDARYVRVVFTEDNAYSAVNYTIVGFLDPRYKQTTMITASVT